MYAIPCVLNPIATTACYVWQGDKFTKKFTSSVFGENSILTQVIHIALFMCCFASIGRSMCKDKYITTRI